MTDVESLLALHADPPRAGRLAGEARERYFGRRTRLHPTVDDTTALPDVARLRDGKLSPLDDWPPADSWESGDRVTLALEPGDEAGRRRYVEWLLKLAHDWPDGVHGASIAPWSRQPGGTARLWAIAVARLALPASVRVEARHDLIGIRLAQVALGFGADTLSGPISADRKLPVAGVTRPTEATLTGLANLIEQAGFDPA